MIEASLTGIGEKRMDIKGTGLIAGAIMLVGGVWLYLTEVRPTELKDEWVYVAITADYTQFAIDRATIRTQSSGHKTAWTRFQGITSDDSQFTFAEYDCREGRWRILQHESVRPDDSVATTIGDPQSWNFARPGSVAAAALEFVCFGKLTD